MMLNIKDELFLRIKKKLKEEAQEQTIGMNKLASILLTPSNETIESEARSIVIDILQDCLTEISPAANTGLKFKRGRKTNTGSVIRKAIAKQLKQNLTLKNPQLWDVVAAKPPKGWTACDNRAGKYLEGSKPGQNMNYARFCNVCGEERKKL